MNHGPFQTTGGALQMQIISYNSPATELCNHRRNQRNLSLFEVPKKELAIPVALAFECLKCSVQLKKKTCK